MDPDKAKSADKAAGADVKVQAVYLSSEYRLVQIGRATVTNSRFLEIFRLDPINSALPGFVGRWDQERNELDVDIVLDKSLGLSKVRRYLIQSRFKKGKSGYSGHHTRERKLHEYGVDIRLSSHDFPELKAEPRVFAGAVTLSRMLFEKHLTASVRALGVSCEARVLDPSGREITEGSACSNQK